MATFMATFTAVISFLVSLATFQAAAECAEQPVFLQMGIQVDGGSRLADLLLEVREECLRSTSSCLPVLEKLRWAVWPHVQAETNTSFSPWMPDQTLDASFGWMAQATGVSPTGTTMAFRHVFKAAGMSVFANLQRITTGFRQLYYPELCNSFHSVHLTDQKHTAFSFVRDPIDRFISAYAEIEYRMQAGLGWPTFDALAQVLREFPEGSSLRARAFFEEFLRNGIDANGHVRPQLDFFQRFQGCSLPMDFIGKTERLEEHWAKLFAMQNETVPRFNSQLAAHSHGDREENAMKIFLWSSAKYIRALCWLYLGDYAVFEYQLPDECQQEPMLSAVAKLRQVSLWGNPLHS